MTAPVIAHLVPIHITAASATTLSSSNQLEETSKVDITEAADVQERKNLNSAGYTQVGSTWRSGSGSLDFKVVLGSSTQTLIAAGGTAFITIITNAAAASGEEKSRRYEVVFESVPTTYEAGNYVSGTASFKVNGAPTIVLGT
ncbi:MAG: hypothetical protein ACJ8AT_06175 [Hyalangium sp.]|uniref:hypothetical protein n=1 Tax=Hyalangium sp. TaxID=2028555 RepID=UPI00389A0CAE